MTASLIDTSLLIELLKEEMTSLDENRIRAEGPSISIITFAELCRYFNAAGKGKEWNEIRAAIAQYHVYPLTPAVAERAAGFCSKLSLADSIIYATAQENGMTLFTRDGDFHGLKNAIVLK